MNRNTRSLRIIWAIIKAIVSLVVIVIVFEITFVYFAKSAETDVSGLDVPWFPVAVITPERTAIIPLESLSEYEKNNPNYTFLVPPGREEVVNQQLRDWQRLEKGTGIPSISAVPISEGKQAIDLDISLDGLFLSRYEASDKEIRPRMFKRAGPLFVLWPVGVTLVIVLAAAYFRSFASSLFRRKSPLRRAVMDAGT